MTHTLQVCEVNLQVQSNAPACCKETRVRKLLTTNGLSSAMLHVVAFGDRVHTCSVGITERCVQENVSKAAAPDVHWLVGNISEDDAAGVHAAHDSLLPDLGLTIRWKAQQP